MRFNLLVAVMTVAALVVAGCGSSDDDPSSNRSARSTDTTGTAFDRGFVAAMIPHHESAVEMAKMAQEKAESDFVKNLAGEMVRTQNAEIATMQSEDAVLAEAGVKKGSIGMDEHMMGMDADMTKLETAKPFDAAFLRMMIPHHEGAVTMAKAELAKGGDPELKKLAQEIIDAQEREIAEMRNHLGEPASSSTDMEHSGH